MWTSFLLGKCHCSCLFRACWHGFSHRCPSLSARHTQPHRMRWGSGPHNSHWLTSFGNLAHHSRCQQLWTFYYRTVSPPIYSVHLFYFIFISFLLIFFCSISVLMILCIIYLNYYMYHVYVCMCVCIYMFMYMCIGILYIYIYTIFISSMSVWLLGS